MTSWKLVNLDGTDDFARGHMDLSWNDGEPDTIEGVDVAAQRVLKASVEPAGSNPFEPRFGSRFQAQIGDKLVDEATLRAVGESVRTMIDSLVTIQKETGARLDLTPAESLVAVRKVTIVQNGTSIYGRASVQTGATQQDFGVHL